MSDYTYVSVWVTASHNGIDVGQEVTIIVKNNKSFIAEVTFIFPESDLAVIEAAGFQKK